VRDPAWTEDEMSLPKGWLSHNRRHDETT